MDVYSYNDFIACEPFPAMEVTTTNKSKYVAVVESSNTLVGLRVIYGNLGSVATNAIVYVLASHKSSAWASPANTVEFNGHKLIFVPLTEIKLLKPPPPEEIV